MNSSSDFDYWYLIFNLKFTTTITSTTTSTVLRVVMNYVQLITNDFVIYVEL